MTYGVRIEWSNGTIETHEGMSRAQAQALADYTAKTFPATKVTVEQEAR
jgi:hypothetical protein